MKWQVIHFESIKILVALIVLPEMCYEKILDLIYIVKSRVYFVIRILLKPVNDSVDFLCTNIRRLNHLNQ